MNIYTTQGRQTIKVLYFGIPIFITVSILSLHIFFIPYFLDHLNFSQTYLYNIKEYTFYIINLYQKIKVNFGLDILDKIHKKDINYVLFQLVTFVLILHINSSKKFFKKAYEKLNYNTTSKWADEETIKEAKLQKKGNKGIILGHLKQGIFKKIAIIVKETLGILIIAPPGTGKTQTLVNMILEGKENTMVILDIKKELYELTSKERQEHTNVIKIEPSEDNPIGWNPFADLPQDLEKKESHISKIGEILFSSSSSGGKDDFFVTSAKQMFIFVTKALIELKGKTSLSEIFESIGATKQSMEEQAKTPQKELNANAYQLFKLAGRIQNLNKGIANNKTLIEYNEKTEKGLVGLSGQANETFTGILQTFNTKLEIFQQESVKKIISSKNSLKFDTLRGLELIKKQNKPTIKQKILKILKIKIKPKIRPVTLYLVIKQDEVDKLKIFINLFFEMLTLFFLSKNSNEAKKGYPITLAIDEFTRFGKMMQIINLSQLSRGMRIQPILITQSIQQVKEIYSNNLTEGLIANSFAQLFFTSNDQTIAEKLSKMIGTYEVKEVEEMKGRKLLDSIFSKGDITKRVTKKPIPLITPQEITSMHSDIVIILIQGFYNRPIRGKRLQLYTNTKMMKRIGKIKEEDLYYNLIKSNTSKTNKTKNIDNQITETTNKQNEATPEQTANILSGIKNNDKGKKDIEKALKEDTEDTSIDPAEADQTDFSLDSIISKISETDLKDSENKNTKDKKEKKIKQYQTIISNKNEDENEDEEEDEEEDENEDKDENENNKINELENTNQKNIIEQLEKNKKNRTKEKKKNQIETKNKITESEKTAKRLAKEWNLNDI